jgi:hypothetical protein
MIVLIDAIVTPCLCDLTLRVENRGWEINIKKFKRLFLSLDRYQQILWSEFHQKIQIIFGWG